MDRDLADTSAATSAVTTVIVGIWSRKREFLGTTEVPAGRVTGASVRSRFSESRDPNQKREAFTVHSFPGGYRVRVREWCGGDKVGEQTLWLAPVEEGEEGYMGLFSREEVRRVIPHLVGSLETVEALEGLAAEGAEAGVARVSGLEQS